MVHSKKCFYPILGQIWTKPNVGSKILFNKFTLRLGVSIFDPTTQPFLEHTVCMATEPTTDTFCNGISSTFFHTLPFYLSSSSVFLHLSRSTCNKQENERRKHNHELHLFPKYSFLQSFRHFAPGCVCVYVVCRCLLSFLLYQNEHVTCSPYISVSVYLSPFPSHLESPALFKLLQTFIHECTERAKGERESRSKNRLRISG